MNARTQVRRRRFGAPAGASRSRGRAAALLGLAAALLVLSGLASPASAGSPSSPQPPAASASDQPVFAEPLPVGLIQVRLVPREAAAEPEPSPADVPSAAPEVPATPADVAEPPATGATVELSDADAAAITAAVRNSPFTEAVPDDAYYVAGTQLSPLDPDWAWTGLRPLTDDLDRADAVLHREPSGEWTVVALGSAEVGCGRVPGAVLASFGIVCYPPEDAPAGTVVGAAAVS
ncbi:MAG: hypothetical protein IRZ08_04290 [Frankia sp.]|nr:hypothetical protein [Frankia sp.]